MVTVTQLPISASRSAVPRDIGWLEIEFTLGSARSTEKTHAANTQIETATDSRHARTEAPRGQAVGA